MKHYQTGKLEINIQKDRQVDEYKDRKKDRQVDEYKDRKKDRQVDEYKDRQMINIKKKQYRNI